jgi:hypothetical protein
MDVIAATVVLVVVVNANVAIVTVKRRKHE